MNFYNYFVILEFVKRNFSLYQFYFQFYVLCYNLKFCKLQKYEQVVNMKEFCVNNIFNLCNLENVIKKFFFVEKKCFLFVVVNN